MNLDHNVVILYKTSRPGCNRRAEIERVRLIVLYNSQYPLPLCCRVAQQAQIPQGDKKGCCIYQGCVMIFLLFHNLLLLVFSRRVHILFRMCRYDYVSLLLVVHPFHSHMFVLWLPHTVLSYYRKVISLIFISLLPWTLSPPLGSLVPSM